MGVQRSAATAALWAKGAVRRRAQSDLAVIDRIVLGASLSGALKSTPDSPARTTLPYQPDLPQRSLIYDPRTNDRAIQDIHAKSSLCGDIHRVMGCSSPELPLCILGAAGGLNRPNYRTSAVGCCKSQQRFTGFRVSASWRGVPVRRARFPVVARSGLAHRTALRCCGRFRNAYRAETHPL